MKFNWEELRELISADDKIKEQVIIDCFLQYCEGNDIDPEELERESFNFFKYGFFVCQSILNPNKHHVHRRIIEKVDKEHNT